MSWRTVVISSRCKLEYKMGYLVIRGTEHRRIFLDEIDVLLIENTGVSLTAYLLAALTEKKIKVIFCDERRNPQTELVPYAGCHDSSLKIRRQLAWSREVKGAVWTEVIREKISTQVALLDQLGKNAESALLQGYLQQLQFADATNREGHAAKVYFHGAFGPGFSREQESPTNAALNYGYSLILSLVNREISAAGYLLQLGLFHDNMFNPFNLGCDLMEPLRVLVDRQVLRGSYEVFETEEKHDLLSLFNRQVTVNGTNQSLRNGIRLYLHSVFRALNEGDLSALQFVRYM